MEIREHAGHRYRYWGYEGGDDLIRRYIDDVLVGGQDAAVFRATTATEYGAQQNALARLDHEPGSGLPLFIENDPEMKTFTIFGYTVGPGVMGLPISDNLEEMSEDGMAWMLSLCENFANAGLPISIEAMRWNSERMGLPPALWEEIKEYPEAVDDSVIRYLAPIVDRWDERLGRLFREMFGSAGYVAQSRAESQQQRNDYAAKHAAEIDAFYARDPVPNQFSPDEVYLVELNGQGDKEIKLVNHETFHWINHGGEPPASLVDALYRDEVEYSEDYTREDAHKSLREMVTGGSPDNDRALAARADVFGGETFEDDTSAALMRFLKKHNLTLAEDQYDGYIY